MMKRAVLVVCLMAPAAAAPVPFAAQPLQVRGDVPVRCKVSQPVAGGALNATFTPGTDGGTLALKSLVDGTSALTNATQAAIAFPINCVGAQSLTITSEGGGLSNAGGTGAPASFATHVNYAMTAAWGGLTQSVTTTGSTVALDFSQTGPQTGSLTISFSVAAGQGPLVSGTYTDRIVIQVNAQ